MEYTTTDAASTQAVGAALAPLLQAGDVILLDGDLGAGKTTFTKGVAAGLGIHRNVKSPTFNLIKEYHQGRLPLYHMDVYRLEGVGGADLGLQEYFNGSGVSLVEWSQFVAEDLPQDFLMIRLQKDDDDFDRRKIIFTPHGNRYATLVDQLAQQLHTN